MVTPRTVRLNSLLKEVISEVIHRDIHHVPHINEFITITSVDITKDLHHAKVYVNIMATPEEKKKALEALCQNAGMIGKMASKKVRMRQFPVLGFFIDEGLDKQLRIEDILYKISEEREKRASEEEETE
mgnify:CR=1 FL=1